MRDLRELAGRQRRLHRSQRLIAAVVLLASLMASGLTYPESPGLREVFEPPATLPCDPGAVLVGSSSGFEPLLWDVAEEHLDEAEFLFQQWERAFSSAELTFDQLGMGWEARLLARVEALIWHGPPVANRLIAPLLVDDGAARDRAAMAALVWLLSPDWDGAREVVGRLASAAGPARAGLIRALQLAPGPALDQLCRDALPKATAPQALGLLEVMAERRIRRWRRDRPLAQGRRRRGRDGGRPARRASGRFRGRDTAVEWALRSELPSLRRRRWRPPCWGPARRLADLPRARARRPRRGAALPGARPRGRGRRLRARRPGGRRPALAQGPALGAGFHGPAAGGRGRAAAAGRRG